MELGWYLDGTWMALVWNPDFTHISLEVHLRFTWVSLIFHLSSTWKFTQNLEDPFQIHRTMVLCMAQFQILPSWILAIHILSSYILDFFWSNWLTCSKFGFDKRKQKALHSSTSNLYRYINSHCHVNDTHFSACKIHSMTSIQGTVLPLGMTKLFNSLCYYRNLLICMISAHIPPITVYYNSVDQCWVQNINQYPEKLIEHCTNGYCPEWLSIFSIPQPD